MTIAKQTKPNTDTAPEHSAHCVLSATANELHDLAGRTAGMQILIGKVIANAELAAQSDLYELQQLDHITQSLEGLADFLTHLAISTPKNWHYPNLAAADVIKLEALAARLTGNACQINATLCEDSGGDLDLF